MRRILPLLLVASFMIFSFLPSAVIGQKKEKGKFDPPDAFQPNDKELEQIKAKTAQLAAKIAELRANGQRKLAGANHATYDMLPDVEIYLRGAENIVRFEGVLQQGQRQRSEEHNV